MTAKDAMMLTKEILPHLEKPSGFFEELTYDY
jgi:hypothetical protein